MQKIINNSLLTKRKPKVTLRLASRLTQVFLITALSWLSQLGGLAYGEVHLHIAVSLDDQGFPSKLTGKFSASGDETTCFYLPFNDRRYRTYGSLESRLQINQNSFRPVQQSSGRIVIDGASPAYLKIKPNEEVVFTARPDRLPAEDRNIWIWEGFHPRRIQSCENERFVDGLPAFAGSERYDVKISVPQGWSYAGLGGPGQRISYSGSQYGFALTRGLNHFSAKGIHSQIKIVGQSQSFLKLLPTIEHSLTNLGDLLGPFPFDSLTVLESSRMAHVGIPGLVLINRARQAALHDIQTHWLNWSHWVSVTSVAQQWLGAYLTLAHQRDEWLFRGSNEFLTLHVLENFPTRFQIYNSIEAGVSPFDFNYRQLQDLGAAVLYQDEPNLVLTDGDYQTVVNLRSQHSQLSLRQAFALRYASYQHSYETLAGCLKAVVAGLQNKPVGPKSFMNQVQRCDGGKIAEDLKRFWRNRGWPDYAIEDLTTRKVGGAYRVIVTAQQRGELELRASVTVGREGVGARTLPLMKVKDRWQAEATLDFEPAYAEIDQERYLYDSNRYNNTTAWPAFKFFPGNARGLADDELTAVWLLYPFRRPGQPWSINLTAGLLRYINGTTFLTLETELGGGHRSAFSLSENYQWPKFSLSGSAAVSQDIFGSRTAAVQANYGPVWATGPRADVRTTIRHRQVVGKPRTEHQTIAGGFVIQNRGERRHLGYRLNSEYESAPAGLSPDLQYESRKITSELYASVPGWLDYRLRGFYGQFTSKGKLADELLFNPEDIELARLRLDEGGLARTEHIYSIGNDLFFPLPISYGDGGVLLTRRLRWQLFYDYGEALDRNTEYRAAGGGLILPVGGDLTGVGTLAITRLNLLLVSYSSVDGKVSRQPRVLFTLGAEL